MSTIDLRTYLTPEMLQKVYAGTSATPISYENGQLVLRDKDTGLTTRSWISGDIPSYNQWITPELEAMYKRQGHDPQTAWLSNFLGQSVSPAATQVVDEGRFTPPKTETFYTTKTGDTIYQGRPVTQNTPGAVQQTRQLNAWEQSGKARESYYDSIQGRGMGGIGGFISRTLSNPLSMAAIAASIAAPGLLSGVISGAGAGAASGGITGLSAGGAYAAPSTLSNIGSALGNFATKSAVQGAIQGGIGGLTSGEGLSGALKGAALGGVTGGYAPAIGSSLGLSGAPLSAFEGSLRGVSGGIATGNLQNAGIGAALGGAGAYLQSGGSVPGLGSLGGELGAGGMGPPTPPSGILGQIGQLSSGITDATGGDGMNISNILRGGAGVLSAGQDRDAIRRQQQALLQGNEAAMGEINRGIAGFDPYADAGVDALGQLRTRLSEGFNPQDLYNDPGYQFQLEQGTDALNRSLAARGMSKSGAALKAAQEYGQGLAGQTYNDAFTRWMSQNQGISGLANTGINAQGQQANLGSVLAGMQQGAGNVNAATIGGLQDARNRQYSSLADLFGGFF